MEFNQKQQHQEDAYTLPYHWLMQDKYTRRGRLYFGYIDFCVDIALKSSGPILDAGCGDGRFLGELVNRKYSGAIYGADYSKRAIEMAELFVPSAKLACADVSSLPYQNSFFDQIFLIETLEHIPPENIKKLLVELKRVMKDDGRLIITVPSSKLGVPSLGSKHYQHFTPELLKNSVREVFNPEKLYGQDETGFSFLKLIDKFADNKLFVISPLQKFYVDKIWKKRFNICDPYKGRRLMVVLKKN